MLLLICAALAILVLVATPFLGRGVAIAAPVLILVLLCATIMFWMMRDKRVSGRDEPDRRDRRDR